MLIYSIKYIIFLVCLPIIFSSAISYAQDDSVETETVEPTIKECFDPISGQKECVLPSPNIAIKDLVCSTENIGSASFSLCNLEREPVIALSIDQSSENYLEQKQPRLPLTIEPEMCVEIIVVGIERKDTIEDCNPESKFCLRAYANKEPGFDCSGNYGFGYNFTSESNDLEGMTGFVSLYTPKKRELDNEE